VADLEEQVLAIVRHPARQDAATRTLKALRKEVQTFEKTFAKSGKQLNKLDKAHAENQQEMLALLGDLNAEWAAGQERALNARFALRDVLTEEEWSAFFGNGQ
jgi:phenylpropionate dioxygenase-like ring-hydroxylating dioxygenase large terminal subunit